MRNCSFFECAQILHYQIFSKFFRLLQELLIKSRSFSLRVRANGLKFLPFDIEDSVRHSGSCIIVGKVHLGNSNISNWPDFKSKEGKYLKLRQKGQKRKPATRRRLLLLNSHIFPPSLSTYFESVICLLEVA